MSKDFDAWLGNRPLVAAGEAGFDFDQWLGNGIVTGDFSPNSMILFTGEITSMSVRGRVLSARAITGGQAFERQIPRFRMGPACNHALFSVGCGLLRADWTFTGTVAGSVAGAFPYTLSLAALVRTTGPAPDYYLGWFAGGWVQIGTERRAILDSTLPVAGALDLTLDRWWRTPPAVSDAVTLFPGCDGLWATCGAFDAVNNPEGRFDNRLNFGGHPFVPVGNPSLVKVSNTVAGGKK